MFRRHCRNLRTRLIERFSRLSCEVAYFGFFDCHFRFVADHCFVGSETMLAFRARHLFQRALAHNAASVLMVHNHPSGSAWPSRLDLECTSRLVQLGEALDIKMIDHLIVGGNNIYSLKLARYI